MNEAIRIESLTKKFNGVQALQGLTLSVPRGSICGFLGRNGAGKTTTIKILMGMAGRDSGGAEVLGLDATDRKQNVMLRRRIGFVSETKELYPT